MLYYRKKYFLSGERRSWKTKRKHLHLTPQGEPLPTGKSAVHPAGRTRRCSSWSNALSPVRARHRYIHRIHPGTVPSVRPHGGNRPRHCPLHPHDPHAAWHERLCKAGHCCLRFLRRPHHRSVHLASGMLDQRRFGHGCPHRQHAPGMRHFVSRHVHCHQQQRRHRPQRPGGRDPVRPASPPSSFGGCA